VTDMIESHGRSDSAGWIRSNTPSAAEGASETGGADGERRVVGWSILMAPGWWRVRLDENRGRSVHALFDHVLASLPRDQVFPARRELEAEINRVVDAAAAAGGAQLYVLVGAQYEVPLAASCLVTVLDVAVPPEAPAEDLARLLADRPGDEPGVLVVDGRECPCVRSVTRPRGVPTGDGGAPVLPERMTLAQASDVLPQTQLDVHVPFPDGGRTLLLTFATPLPPVLAEAMTGLFEAMAESVRWRWE